MSERLDELGATTMVVLVTFTQSENVADYQDRNQLPFPILVDPDRSAYRAFGLGRGSVWRIYGWRVARKYLEIYRTDGLTGLTRPIEDTLQLGGDFVIAADGTLAYGFWGHGPDDRPPVDDLINSISALNA